MFDTLPQIVSWLMFVLFLALAALVGVMYREDEG